MTSHQDVQETNQCCFDLSWKIGHIGHATWMALRATNTNFYDTLRDAPALGPHDSGPSCCTLPKHTNTKRYRYQHGVAGPAAQWWCGKCITQYLHDVTYFTSAPYPSSPMPVWWGSATYEDEWDAEQIWLRVTTAQQPIPTFLSAQVQHTTRQTITAWRRVSPRTGTLPNRRLILHDIYITKHSAYNSMNFYLKSNLSRVSFTWVWLEEDEDYCTLVSFNPFDSYTRTREHECAP